MAVPLADQYMNKYWPSISPWKTSELRPRTMPISKFQCPHKGCPKNFGEMKQLAKHMRCGHTLFEIRKLGIPSVSGVEWIGDAR